MSVRRPDARERRTIALGATVLIVAFAGVFVVRPAVRRWTDREAGIAAARGRVQRLATLASSQDQLVRLAGAQRDPSSGSIHLLRGRTVPLVAADLQRLLQEQARVSRVSVTRLEVDSGDSTSAERGVTASLSATTDVYGVGDLLQRLRDGDVLLTVDELSVAPNPVLRGGLLQLGLRVRAPFVLEP